MVVESGDGGRALAVFEVVGVKCEQGWVMKGALLFEGFGFRIRVAVEDSNPLRPRQFLGRQNWKKISRENRSSFG
jgi:hypothetical protein